MNLRKEVREQNLKKWQSQGPAMVVKPLRFIAEKTNGVDEKGNAILSPEFVAASKASEAGQGDKVQKIARLVHTRLFA